MSHRLAMTLTRRMLTRAMIARNGKTWNTRRERRFNDYKISRGLGLVQNVSLPFVDVDLEGARIRYDFQLDFARPSDSTYDIDFEIDGKGHKDKTDHWKDGVKNKQGLKVIHIPGVLTEKKWWAYLDNALNAAMLSTDATVNIAA